MGRGQGTQRSSSVSLARSWTNEAQRRVLSSEVLCGGGAPWGLWDPEMAVKKLGCIASSLGFPVPIN